MRGAAHQSAIDAGEASDMGKRQYMIKFIDDNQCDVFIESRNGEIWYRRLAA